MKIVTFSIAATLTLSACATTSSTVPSVNVKNGTIIGCTYPVDLPACASEQRRRPYFGDGSHLGDLELAYEDVKGALLKSEECIDLTVAAVKVHEGVCFDGK